MGSVTARIVQESLEVLSDDHRIGMYIPAPNLGTGEREFDWRAQKYLSGRGYLGSLYRQGSYTKI